MIISALFLRKGWLFSNKQACRLNQRGGGSMGRVSMVANYSRKVQLFLHPCQRYKIKTVQKYEYFISKLQSLYSKAVSINIGFSLGKRSIYWRNFCLPKEKNIHKSCALLLKFASFHSALNIGGSCIVLPQNVFGYILSLLPNRDVFVWFWNERFM